MEKKGMYIYGVLNSDRELFFGPHGVTACEEVYTVSYRDISAVVSDSEIADYARMRKDVLAMFLIRHQKAIEKIMNLGHTIIPMRLGTFAKDGDDVKHILGCGYSIINDIFTKISDMIEIDVTATLGNFNSALKEIGEDKEIKEFKEGLLASPGGVTVDDQMKIGLMIKDALDKIRKGYSNKIQAALKSVSHDFRVHELMDDRMAANIAFLISKARHKDFEKKVDGLNVEFNEKLNFRCVGPLPPYSFYTLEIKTLKNEDMDWAKTRLGISSDIISKDEVKKAYQRQALSTHPDRNPNVPGAGKEFDEVNRAYKILTEYCAALEQAHPVRDKGSHVGDKISNGANQKENAMLVRVRPDL